MDEEKVPRRMEPVHRIQAAGERDSRECGGCTACCTVMSVTEIGNASGMRCPNECDGGCAIYEVRPAGCRGFTCLWLADDRGVLGPEHRPDRIGLVLTDDGESTGPAATVAAREYWPGAAAEPEARRLLSFLGRFVTVRVIPAPGQSAAA